MCGDLCFVKLYRIFEICNPRSHLPCVVVVVMSCVCDVIIQHDFCCCCVWLLHKKRERQEKHHSLSFIIHCCWKGFVWLQEDNNRDKKHHYECKGSCSPTFLSRSLYLTTQ